MNAKTMTLEMLTQAVAGDGIAIRCRRRLQPAGGSGDKLAPPTYEGGQYATETRKVDGKDLPCVLLDSVQSQANRIEQALKTAYYTPGAESAEIPIIAVDFASSGLPEVGWLTSLDAPHRIADAILRDSLCNGKKFRESDAGRAFANATQSDATALFVSCPTALLLGMWDSTGPKGGLGSKFQRALVSEIVGVNAVAGVKTESRIDPLNIASGAGPIFAATEGGWTLENTGKKYGKEGKPSEINHCNVTPSISDAGGVTVDYALQTTVISLAALRRLHFPLAEGDADTAARAALAALGVCGAVLAQSDADLRSRCLLVPEEVARWEFISANGNTTVCEIDAKSAQTLLTEASAQAEKARLAWNKDVLVLQPSAPLAELVKRSRALQAAQPAEG
jgi:CRISPR-associated protein Csb1